MKEDLNKLYYFNINLYLNNKIKLFEKYFINIFQIRYLLLYLLYQIKQNNLMKLFNELTTEDLQKIAQNYILSVTSNIQVLSFAKHKIEYYINKPSLFIIGVRCIYNFGKKETIKVYIHSTYNNSDLIGDVTGIDFNRKKAYDLINIDLIQNPIFLKSFEEIQQERKQSEEKYQHEKFIDELKKQINYNLKQKRSPKASKISYIKHGIEKLENAITELNEEQQIFLASVIDEINSVDRPKQTIKEFIASFFGAKREIFEQLESTFSQNENKIRDNYSKWLKKNDDKITDKEVNKLVEYYTENQKWNLFKSVVKYLNNLEIKSCENLLFNNTNNGFEGTWKLILQDDSIKFFNTHTIIAEGLIQRAHYRYLINLK